MKIKLNVIFIRYIAILTVIFISYSPSVWIESAHHDNTRYFSTTNAYSFKSNCYNDSQHGWLYMLGRPITAEIECQVFKHAHKLSDLGKMRTIVIGIIAAAAFTLTNILIMSGVDRWVSLLISIAIFTLPGMQNASFMTNIPNALTSFMALLAYAFIFRITPGLPWRQGYREISSTLLSLLLLALSAMTYPALAFLFFWGSLARIIIRVDESYVVKIKSLARDTVLFAMSALSGMIMAKIVMPSALKPYLSSIPESYKPDFSLSGILSRIPFVVHSVIPMAARLWFLYNKYAYVVVFMLFVAAAVYYACRYLCDKIESPFTNMLASYFIILIVISYACAPFLLARSPMIQERLLFPVMGMIVVFITLNAHVFLSRNFKMFGCGGLEIVFPMCVASVGLIYSSYTMAENVWNTNTEMQFVRTELAKYNHMPRRIHIVRPIDNGMGFNGIPSFSDEFNRKTTDYRQDILNFVRLSIYGSSGINGIPLVYCNPMKTSCDNVVPKLDTIVSISNYGQKVCSSNDMAIVDMNVLVRATHTGHPKLVRLRDLKPCKTSDFHISTDAVATGHDVGRAFDNSEAPDSFWETSISKPITVTVRYDKPTAVQHYKLYSGQFAGRMPIRWGLYASNDNIHWHLLNKVDLKSAWQANTRRDFSVNSHDSFMYYRFVFYKAEDKNIMRLYELELVHPK